MAELDSDSHGSNPKHCAAPSSCVFGKHWFALREKFSERLFCLPSTHCFPPESISQLFHNPRRSCGKAVDEETQINNFCWIFFKCSFLYLFDQKLISSVPAIGRHCLMEKMWRAPLPYALTMTGRICGLHNDISPQAYSVYSLKQGKQYSPLLWLYNCRLGASFYLLIQCTQCYGDL